MNSAPARFCPSDRRSRTESGRRGTGLRSDQGFSEGETWDTTALYVMKSSGFNSHHGASAVGAPGPSRCQAALVQQRPAPGIRGHG